MAIANDSHHAPSAHVEPMKPLGQYFVDAGLLNEAQIRVALTDQQITGMLFGEVVVARGWMKEQTVEYLVQKVVVPERKRLEAKRLQAKQSSQHLQAYPTHPQTGIPTVSQALVRDGEAPDDPSNSSFKRKDPPIAKPLPSVNSVDSDVSWVG
jgi:hypothetical protein